MNRRVYLDHHAATPLGEAARRAMEEAAPRAWANASSAHREGRAARALLEAAREAISSSVGARPQDLILTSGGTEACNLGVLGFRARRCVTSPLEHPAVLEAARAHEALLVVPVGRGEPPAPEDLPIEPGDLVALQYVSHETGVIAPVRAYADRCRAAGATLFVDAIQAYGRVPLDVGTLGADAVAIASHKVGGPSGAGALWVREGALPNPRALGGGQERGRRGGSPDVLATVGFGAAAQGIAARLEAMATVARWRDALEATLVDLGASVHGAESPRVASCTHVHVPGWRSAELVAALDLEGVATSAGAACSSGVVQASPPVRAWYPDDASRAQQVLRVTLGPEGLETSDVDRAAEVFRRVIPRGNGSR
ncbi:MAG: aminotransferase class V-fold PLP-dependent enzyme [Myxococcales bacterium]|nr:aminotransferase class V-fold PLP-dependent enzyme [Myxococcales bacterium]